jgi:hypothetical protein
MVKVTIQDHDSSLPAPPARPLHTGVEHDAIRAFRHGHQELYRLLVRLVDSGHIDSTTLTLLNEITARGTALHAHLDAVDAAWMAAHTPEAKES